MTVGGEEVNAAVAEMIAALAPHVTEDWGVKAGALDWTCWATAAHVAHDLLAYAAQVVARVADGYLPLHLVTDRDASPAQVLDVVGACGKLLGQVVASASEGSLAWHWGMSDASGFAAMGIAEVLVHTHDIAAGLGVAWSVPDRLAGSVVDRLLPEAPSGKPSAVLLWATGRGDLDGHERVTNWVWRAVQP